MAKVKPKNVPVKKMSRERALELQKLRDSTRAMNGYERDILEYGAVVVSGGKTKSEENPEIYCIAWREDSRNYRLVMQIKGIESENYQIKTSKESPDVNYWSRLEQVGDLSKTKSRINGLIEKMLEDEGLKDRRILDFRD